MFKYISTAYPNGYTLNMPTYNGLSVTSAGSVGGLGVFLKETGTFINAGNVDSTKGDDGVGMKEGGVVSNSGSLGGYNGVWAPDVSQGGDGATLNVSNFGVIIGTHNGVQLDIGGTVSNSGTIGESQGGDATVTSDAIYDLAGAVYNTGKIVASYNKASANYHSGVDVGTGVVKNGTYQGGPGASITGYYGVNATGTATVTNYATIRGVYAGVQQRAGGFLTNGDAYDTTALIKGQIDGVKDASADVSNFGTIQGGLRGVVTGGAQLDNGFVGDFSALIEGGWTGVDDTAPTANVYNWGTIEATLVDHSAVTMNGGTLTNGATTDPAALIQSSLGVDVFSGGAVINFGQLKATYVGVAFYDGGRLTNGSVEATGALIEADEGVAIKVAAGTVVNFATILCQNPGEGGGARGVYLADGGAVTNGAVDDTAALITGAYGVLLDAAGTVTNYGLISGAADAGVSLTAGGVVVNGAPTDPDATIEGLYGVALSGSGTVSNLGTVTSTSAKAGAVDLRSGGEVVNGSGGDHNALLQGAVGVSVAGAAGFVVNYATVSGENGAGVLASAGATVTNGGGADRGALIEGLNGVDVTSGAGTVRNFATIAGEGASGTFGVYLQHGGALTNGAAGDKAALIEGYAGVRILGAGQSTNFGTIHGLGSTGDDFGVNVGQAGNMTNGSAIDADALIEGYIGALLGGSSTMTNFGTILGAAGVAVKFINSAATLVVESGSSLDGIVQGDGGHLDLASGSGTLSLKSGDDLTVSGSIPADTFDDIGAVQIGAGAAFTVASGGAIASGQSLVDDGAATDNGALTVGTGASLTLAGTLSGTGTLAITGGAATFDAGSSLAVSAVTLSGACAVTVAASLAYAGAWSQAAGTVTVDDGATFSLTGTADTFSGSIAGAGTIAFAGGGDTLSGLTLRVAQADIDGATVTVPGAATVTVTGGELAVSTGTLDVSGTVGGTGTLTATGGAVSLAAGTSLSIAHADVSGTAAVGLTTSLAYAGVWKQTAGTLTVAAKDTATFTGAGDTLGGTLAGAGTVDLAAGSATLAATTIAAGTSLDAAGASVTLSGAIANAGAITESGGKIVVAASGASLTGVGTVTMSNLATNEIIGATSAATLSVGQVLQGAGAVGAGQMTLDVLSSGVVRSAGADLLTIDTGTNVIDNAGAIVAVGAGGATIISAVDNTGRLIANGATLTVEGAVTGTGEGQVSAGTLYFTASASFEQDVVFTTGSTGTLELADSQAYSGTISGFSLAGATALDLADIAYASGTTKATYVGTASGGILTVANGTHSADIHLTGDYLTSTWTLTADGHGGTRIVDPAAASHATSIQGFVQTLVQIAPSRAAAPHAADPWRDPAPPLATPRSGFA